MFHYNVKKIFKLKKPSPIMTELTDPITSKAATDERKQIITEFSVGS